MNQVMKQASQRLCDCLHMVGRVMISLTEHDRIVAIAWCDT